MRQPSFLLLGATLVVGVSGIVTGTYFSVKHQDISCPTRVRVSEKEYTLECSVTEEAQAVGLSGREKLCESCAMVFPFQTPGNHPFWMKGMHFPLDMVWLSVDGAVVHIEHRILETSEQVYHSEIPAVWVFEFNAGSLDTLEKGEKLQLVWE